MKFEQMGSNNGDNNKSPHIPSRRGFLRNTGIVVAGSMIPKFLHGEKNDNNVEILEKSYLVLGKKIQALVQTYAPKGGSERKPQPLFFNMHDNEKTSVMASRRVMKEFGGRLLELRNAGERLISGSFGGKNFSFDPNRIFTTKGVKDTLEKYNSKPIPPEVLDDVWNFGQQLLQDFNLENEKILISLHNNSEGGYSIKDYKTGGREALATREVFISHKKDSDDFFYVTSKEDFEKIKQMNYNVILQGENVPDDGSLAVLAGEKGMRYINVEAEHHKTDTQERMIRDIYKGVI